jgi:hypothetical protein
VSCLLYPTELHCSGGHGYVGRGYTRAAWLPRASVVGTTTAGAKRRPRPRGRRTFVTLAEILLAAAGGPISAGRSLRRLGWSELAGTNIPKKFFLILAAAFSLSFVLPYTF